MEKNDFSQITTQILSEKGMSLSAVVSIVLLLISQRTIIQDLIDWFRGRRSRVAALKDAREYLELLKLRIDTAKQFEDQVPKFLLESPEFDPYLLRIFYVIDQKAENGRPSPSSVTRINTTKEKLIFGGVGSFLFVIVGGIALFYNNAFKGDFIIPIILIIIVALVCGLYGGILTRLIFWNPVSRLNAALVGFVSTTLTGALIAWWSSNHAGR